MVAKCPSCGRKMEMDKMGFHCHKCMKTIETKLYPWKFNEQELKRYYNLKLWKK